MLTYWQTLETLQVQANAVSANNTQQSLTQGATQARALLSPPGSSKLLNVIGDAILIKAAGTFQNINSAGQTSTWALTFTIPGGASTVVAQSQAIRISDTAHAANISWYLEWMLTLRAVGAASQFIHQGYVISQAYSLAADSTTTVASIVPIPAAGPALGTAFDFTQAQQADLAHTFSVNNAGNIIQMQKYWLINCT
jgi:hypothetical protein